ncbi:cytochrome P450 [Dacryopinax primogenitus]|uniref:Cytochrome P450 n=1 Tax=Dacryopinax primogenitus (strain DJM 731) TaxID=1858805 RepID=M5GAM0_DACPD|nr:cytochrome P450 [Dacryopinax primogenitus]EJU05909.1 cytochrome P450 [Dacryopinax primogenitus]
MAFISSSLSSSASLLLSLLAVYTLLRLTHSLLSPLWSPLRNLPHPKGARLLWGNVKQIRRAPLGETHARWERELGPVFSYRQTLSKWRLCTTDPRALSHILQNAYLYPKPGMVQRSLSRTVGDGLLVAEGDAHKRQRRVMNPSFSSQQIKEVVPVFWDKAEELASIWHASVRSEEAVVDVNNWLSRATLDVIGLAGFGYAFQSLLDDSNELALAVAQLFHVRRVSVFAILRNFFPALRYLPVQSNRIQANAHRVMTRIGMELVKRKKEAVRQTLDGKREEKDVVRTQVVGKDLLSALVRANMANDVTSAQKLNDEEVLAQISTFLVAGHETTSSAVTWALFTLSTDQDVQNKLRAELLSYPSPQSDMDELSAIPYLDAFVREVMRFHAPVASTMRMASAADEIPVSRPYVDTNGKERTTISVKKGDGIFIPIRVVNRSTSLWGPDAGEFRPERWLREVPDAANHIPGVWAHVLSFLGGPRACIGYRFSIIEIKVFLYVLIRQFTFQLADPGMEFEAKSNIVTRPVVKGGPRDAPTLPLRIRRYTVEDT